MPPHAKKKKNISSTNQHNDKTNTHSHAQTRSGVAASKATTSQPVAPTTGYTEDDYNLKTANGENLQCTRTSLPCTHKNIDPAEPDRPRPRRSSAEVQAEKVVGGKEEAKEDERNTGKGGRIGEAEVYATPKETENEGYGSEVNLGGERDINTPSDSAEFIDVDNVSEDSSSEGIVKLKPKAKQKPGRNTGGDGRKGKKRAASGTNTMQEALTVYQPSRKTGLSKRFKASLQAPGGREFSGLADSDIEDIALGEAEGATVTNQSELDDNGMIGLVNDYTTPVNSQPGLKGSSAVSSRQPSVEFNPLPKKGAVQTAHLPTARAQPGSQHSSRAGSRSASHTHTPAESRAHSPNPAAQGSGEKGGQRVRTSAKKYPEFIRGNWSSHVLPTTKHAMFASDQPMVKFRRDKVLLETVQDIVNRTFPEIRYVCSLDRDAVFQQIYNRLNETHSEIGSKAIKTVGEFFSHPEYNGHYRRILEYATWASDRLEDGPTFYAEPSASNIKPSDGNYVPPRGLFQSYFVIEMMKFYMSKMAQSSIEYGRPVGLVGLVCAAIKRAFQYYVKSKGHPPLVSLTKESKQFSEVNVGKHVKAFVHYVASLTDDEWEDLMVLYEYSPNPPLRRGRCLKRL
ncbi:hypothetical protein E1B28_006760 [Marasmius oreades]|uniref:Uncharacterized protein n=1 Tax=Marasmius oreades TaxID=181124 RepID=A0A9P7UWR8_9AGAR|nr:uncharacterized protein E1B28_006760 [Marasmius oreades]KAG7096079.1 hypothetical protein E1B28_006760 [Marasmius oreades]